MPHFCHIPDTRYLCAPGTRDHDSDPASGCRACQVKQVETTAWDGAVATVTGGLYQDLYGQEECKKCSLSATAGFFIMHPCEPTRDTIFAACTVCTLGYVRKCNLTTDAVCKTTIPTAPTTTAAPTTATTAGPALPPGAPQASTGGEGSSTVVVAGAAAGECNCLGNYCPPACWLLAGTPSPVSPILLHPSCARLHVLFPACLLSPTMPHI